MKDIETDAHNDQHTKLIMETKTTYPKAVSALLMALSLAFATISAPAATLSSFLKVRIDRKQLDLSITSKVPVEKLQSLTIQAQSPVNPPSTPAVVTNVAVATAATPPPQATVSDPSRP